MLESDVESQEMDNAGVRIVKRMSKRGRVSFVGVRDMKGKLET